MHVMTGHGARPIGEPGKTYEAIRDGFRWEVPDFFNIGVDVADEWARRDPERIAIIDVRPDGQKNITFREMAESSNRLANLLVTHGLRRGDRVGILAPQRAETAIAHVAVYKAGAIAVPLFSLFGSDALRHRLFDCGARCVIADAAGLAKVEEIRGELPALAMIVPFDTAGGASPSFEEGLSAFSPSFDPVLTSADDPALIIYTSGTTGASKGAVHAHRVLLGHLPGVEMSHDGFPQPGDRMWTPADWAWIGGLLDVLLPALHHGITVVARRFEKFDAESAFEPMQDYSIRNVFLPPTALKLMRSQDQPRERWRLVLRSVASGGESLGAELLTWGDKALGVQINEFYGQTECNVVVSSCGALFAARRGAIGKSVPGHTVAVIDEDGDPAPVGQEGDIAVRAPDPVMFLGYWDNDRATREKYRGDWLVTGDRGAIDSDGFIHFIGRADDVITSAGYRIGPGEIEDCLLKHPAVALAGVVGAPDEVRTEVVTAFVVLRPDFRVSPSLTEELQAHVRARLGGHVYPRALRYVSELPMTVTGKIIRRELRKLAGETADPMPG